MGGGQPAYTAIERQMTSDPGSVIDTVRMPPTITILRDMKHWSRYELDQWVMHALRGQRGQLPSSQIFYFRLVPARPGQTPKLVESPRSKVQDGVRIDWTPVELLYAQKMLQISATKSASIQTRWNGLPPARSSHIYAAYSLDIYHALMTIHCDDPDMISLVEEIAEMEQDCPLHVCTQARKRMTLLMHICN